MEKFNFDNIYKLYKDDVYNKAYSIVKRKDYAQDVSQDTFINVFNALNNGKKPDNVRAWLMEITKNNSLKYIEKELDTQIYIDKLAEEDANKLDGGIIYDLGYERINREGEKFISVYVYYFSHGYTTKEIAEELEITDNLVRQRLLKIRNWLKEITKNRI